MERNTFISPDHPRLKIQVSDEIPFKNSARTKISPSDNPTPSGPVIIKVESHIFSDTLSGKTIKISLETLTDQRSKWEICLPDYSAFEDTIHTGWVKISGTRFSTGTFLFSAENGWFLGRTYAKIVGSSKNTRLQIHYTEKIDYRSHTPASIEAFQNRADRSFTVQSIEENQTDKRQARINT